MIFASDEMSLIFGMQLAARYSEPAKIHAVQKEAAVVRDRRLETLSLSTRYRPTTICI